MTCIIVLGRKITGLKKIWRNHHLMDIYRIIFSEVTKVVKFPKNVMLVKFHFASEKKLREFIISLATYIIKNEGLIFLRKEELASHFSEVLFFRKYSLPLLPWKIAHKAWPWWKHWASFPILCYVKRHKSIVQSETTTTKCSLRKQQVHWLGIFMIVLLLLLILFCLFCFVFRWESFLHVIFFLGAQSVHHSFLITRFTDSYTKEVAKIIKIICF